MLPCSVFGLAGMGSSIPCPRGRKSLSPPRERLIEPSRLLSSVAHICDGPDHELGGGSVRCQLQARFACELLEEPRKCIVNFLTGYFVPEHFNWYGGGREFRRDAEISAPGARLSRSRNSSRKEMSSNGGRTTRCWKPTSTEMSG